MTETPELSTTAKIFPSASLKLSPEALWEKLVAEAGATQRWSRIVDCRAHG